QGTPGSPRSVGLAAPSAGTPPRPSGPRPAPACAPLPALEGGGAGEPGAPDAVPTPATCPAGAPFEEPLSAAAAPVHGGPDRPGSPALPVRPPPPGLAPAVPRPRTPRSSPGGWLRAAPGAAQPAGDPPLPPA